MQGAIMGAAHGVSGIPRPLLEGLHDGKAIGSEIDDYISTLYPEGQEQQGGKAGAAAGVQAEL
jgi:hypothetical protein